jgi:uncharacterized protein YjbI with pentapeptide repeats
VVSFYCDEEPLASGFCVFHDEGYLQDKTNNEDHKRKVLDRLWHKVNHALSNNEPLLCIGFQLPDFSLSDLSISKEFTVPVYFSDSQFVGKAHFTEANFKGTADFSGANFQGGAFFYEANFEGGANFYSVNFQGRVNFHSTTFYAVTKFNQAEFQRADYYRTIFKKMVDLTGATFYGEVDFIESEFADSDETIFRYVVFYSGDKTFFHVADLSKASFLNTDLTEVRFNDKASLGEKAKDRFKIRDERILEEKFKGSDGAGQFFIREMELKRKYREVISKEEENSLEIKQNNWFRRNLFSLTGWYYHLSRYGESIWRPTLAGLVIVFLSTLFWLIQSDPSGEPSFTNTVGFTNAGEITVWQTAFERSMADFLPILSMINGVKVGLIDFIIKIVGGAVTFGLIAVALRRRFERRYR